MFPSTGLSAGPSLGLHQLCLSPHNPGVCSPLPSRLLLGQQSRPQTVHPDTFFWGGGVLSLLYFSSGHLTPKSLFIYMLRICLPSWMRTPAGQGFNGLARGCVPSMEKSALATTLINAYGTNACLLWACPHVAPESREPLWLLEPIRSPERKHANDQTLAIGDKRKWTAHSGLLWASAKSWYRNFLTLKELWVHWSPTYTAHRSTANLPGPASICLWAMGKRFASKMHLSHSVLMHLLLTGDPDMIFISRLVIYNGFKWPVHPRVWDRPASGMTPELWPLEA